MRELTLRAGSVLLVGLLCVLWWWASDVGLLQRAFVPNPLDAWDALIEGFTSGELAAQTGGTLLRMAEGWALAATAGVLLGALIGISPVTHTYLQPTLEFLRPLPASAIIPVAIAFFGLSPTMAVFVVAFGSIWPVLLSTVHGFTSVDTRLYDVAACLEMPRYAVVGKIALPNAAADILAGCRLSLTTALILSVVCEMLAAQTGLGTAILLAARAFRSADVFAGVAVLGAVGLSIELGLTLVERWFIRWRHT